MHKRPIHLAKNTYLPYSLCIKYDFLRNTNHVRIGIIYVKYTN